MYAKGRSYLEAQNMPFHEIMEFCCHNTFIHIIPYLVHKLKIEKVNFYSIKYYCEEPDKFDKKHPDRTMGLKLHVAAGKALSYDHVLRFTNDLLRIMAAKMQESKILAILNTSDVRALELYYHLSCHNSFVKKYHLQLRNEKN